MLTNNNKSKTRSEISPTVTTTVKIYFEGKIQSVKEFHQIGNEIPMILYESIKQIWIVALLCSVMSLLIVKDTTSETETFLKNVK